MEKKQYTILEHYVPICYLKNFSVSEKDGQFAYCLFRHNATVRKVNIRNICAVKDLYELKSHRGYIDRNDIEDGFIKIEAAYSSFCRDHIPKSIQCKNIILSPLDIELLKTFFAILELRHKRLIEMLIKLSERIVECDPPDWSNVRKIIKSIDSQTIEEELIPYLNQVVAYGSVHGYIKKLFNTSELSVPVMALKEMLGENYCFLYSNNGFITSDTPVVNIYGQNAISLGFRDIICIPLSTNCCIVFSDNDINNGDVINLSPEQVDIVNQAQISKKYELLISRESQSISKYF